MIERLESAGLGYYVRASKTQERLGMSTSSCALSSFDDYP